MPGGRPEGREDLKSVIMVRPLYRDPFFFDIVDGVLQGDTLKPFTL